MYVSNGCVHHNDTKDGGTNLFFRKMYVLIADFS